MNKNMKKLIRGTVFATSFAAFTIPQVAINAAETSTFTDITNSTYEQAIQDLYGLGYVSGTSTDAFDSEENLTNAQMIQLLVNVFDLNTDTMKFEKEPSATDYFENADNDAWYADAFVLAGANGVDLSSTIAPSGDVTREEFIKVLVQLMEKTYDIGNMSSDTIEINDADTIDIEDQIYIQSALSYGIVELDDQGNFNPNDIVTRGEAASMIDNMLNYVIENSSYSDALELAKENGFDLFQVFAGTQTYTKQAFIYELVTALEDQYQLPMINLMAKVINDEDEINSTYEGAIQRALIYGITSLDEDGNLNPTENVDPATALTMVENALDFAGVTTSDNESESSVYQEAIDLAAKSDWDLSDIINVDAIMTKQDFIEAVMTSFDERFNVPDVDIEEVDIADEDEIASENKEAIETALNYGIIELDSDQDINADDAISSEKAYTIIEKALAYVDSVRSTGHSTPMESAITGELTSEEVSDGLDLTLTVSNDTDTDLPIEYSSGQTYDVYVYDQDDNLVYQWSNDRMFTMMIIEDTLEAGDTMTFETIWDKTDNDGNLLPAGQYTIDFITDFTSDGQSYSVDDSMNYVIE